MGAVRPDWWDDEVAKLGVAAADGRWRVREVVALALQRLLDADWDRTVRVLLAWAAADDALVVRAAAAAVAEPPLLRSEDRWAAAAQVQRRAVERLRAYPAQARRVPPVRVLRQALGFTVSVVVAASGDFALLEDMATSGDPDPIGVGLPEVGVCWGGRRNMEGARGVHRVALGLHHPVAGGVLLFQDDAELHTDGSVDQDGPAGRRDIGNRLGVLAGIQPALDHHQAGRLLPEVGAVEGAEPDVVVIAWYRTGGLRARAGGDQSDQQEQCGGNHAENASLQLVLLGKRRSAGAAGAADHESERGTGRPAGPGRASAAPPAASGMLTALPGPPPLKQ